MKENNSGNLFFSFRHIYTTLIRKLQQLKIKITGVNTKTADAIERTFQTTSAHTTKRIKMEWGWGRLRPATLVNHLSLRETTSISDELDGCNQNVLVIFKFKLFITI